VTDQKRAERYVPSQNGHKFVKKENGQNSVKSKKMDIRLGKSRKWT
jgi:hypothetical protein